MMATIKASGNDPDPNLNMLCYWLVLYSISDILTALIRPTIDESIPVSSAKTSPFTCNFHPTLV